MSPGSLTGLPPLSRPWLARRTRRVGSGDLGPFVAIASIAITAEIRDNSRNYPIALLRKLAKTGAYYMREAATRLGAGQCTFQKDPRIFT